MSKPPGEWKPADATRRINECARHADLRIALTVHAKAQMRDRDLLMGDVLHLLRKGFVYDKPEPSTREGFFKYAVEGTTPNSEGRTVKAIAIPGTGHEVKIVTVMWRDEQ